MKITIEPTGEDLVGYTTVSLSSLSNDIDAEEALRMVHAALVAWGYPAACIYYTGDNDSELST